jgi:hypothetical protein
MSANGRKTWSLDLDGNCGSQGPVLAEDSHKIYATSDAHTLYSISPAGQVLWQVEQACKKSEVYIHPLPSDDVVVACSDQSLYCLRGGNPRWTFMMDGTSGWSWSNTVSDKSGNIYYWSGRPLCGHATSSRQRLGQADLEGFWRHPVHAQTVRIRSAGPAVRLCRGSHRLSVELIDICLEISWSKALARE